LCTYRAVYITSSRPRSLEGVICVFAADFSLTFFPRFFTSRKFERRAGSLLSH
jgi:hypothetical protein